MKKFGFSETKLWKGIFIALISTSLLSACGGSSSSDDDDNSGDDTSNGSVTLPDGFPEGVKMSFIDASSPQYMLLDTEASTLVDLNDLAASSSDSAVQKLAISDTSSLSHLSLARFPNGE